MWGHLSHSWCLCLVWRVLWLVEERSTVRPGQQIWSLIVLLVWWQREFRCQSQSSWVLLKIYSNFFSNWKMKTATDLERNRLKSEHGMSVPWAGSVELERLAFNSKFFWHFYSFQNNRVFLARIHYIFWHKRLTYLRSLNMPISFRNVRIILGI